MEDRRRLRCAENATKRAVLSPHGTGARRLRIWSGRCARRFRPASGRTGASFPALFAGRRAAGPMRRLAAAVPRSGGRSPPGITARRSSTPPATTAAPLPVVRELSVALATAGRAGGFVQASPETSRGLFFGVGTEPAETLPRLDRRLLF